MKIEKLPSGSYRIRQQYKGKRYTVITDYKPTQKEATQLIAAEFDKAVRCLLWASTRRLYLIWVVGKLIM